MYLNTTGSTYYEQRYREWLERAPDTVEHYSEWLREAPHGFRKPLTEHAIDELFDATFDQWQEDEGLSPQQVYEKRFPEWLKRATSDPDRYGEWIESAPWFSDEAPCDRHLIDISRPVKVERRHNEDDLSTQQLYRKRYCERVDAAGTFLAYTFELRHDEIGMSSDDIFTKRTVEWKDRVKKDPKGYKAWLSRLPKN